MKKCTIILTILVSLISSIILFSQTIPQTINYQGVLKDAAGVVVTNGDYNITFKLYTTESGGTELWTETKLITVIDGIINSQLGSATLLNLPFDAAYWLGITVSSGSELTPRIKLSSVPYSFMTMNVMDGSITTSKLQDGSVTTNKIADNSVNSSKIIDGTITASDIGDNQVIKKINGIKDSVNIIAGSNVTITPSGNTITIDASGGSSGTITGVTAGSGLTGGGTSGNVTLSVADNGISTVMLQDNSVNSSKITDGTVVTADLSNNSVTTDKVVDGTLTANDIGNNQVIKKVNGIRDSVSFVGGTNVTITPSGNSLTISSTNAGGTITGVTAGSGLTGGGTSGTVTLSISTDGITNAMLSNNSVTSTKISDGTIVTADLSDNSITTGKIVDGTITVVDLAASSVTSDKIADGTVTSTDILNGTITATDIATTQVVKSLNTLKDDVTLVAGSNITITPSGQNLTIASTTAGDNWGTQVVKTDATLSGNGTGTSLLKLSQQSATNGQVLKWNGTTWAPANDALGELTLPYSGTGTSGSPLFNIVNLGTSGAISTLSNGNYAIWGESASSSGMGVYGANKTSTGTTYGVFGDVYSSTGYSGYFQGGKFYVQGNAGIGTQNPTGMLEIYGNSVDTYPQLLLSESDGYARVSFRTMLASTKHWVLAGHTNVTDATSQWHLNYFNGSVGKNIFSVYGNSNIAFDGNVGIGTQSPGAKLDVAGQVKITGGTPGTGKVLTSDASGLASWQAPELSPWLKNGSDLYYNSGYVALGMTFPRYRLTIYDDNNSFIGFYNSTSGTSGTDGFTIGTMPSGSPVWIWNWENSNMHFATNNTNRMIINADGHISMMKYLDLNTDGTFGALYVSGNQALWWDGTYFSWGYGGQYNYFADKVTIGNAANPSYMLYVQGSAYATGQWNSSDARFKKNIASISNALDRIMKVRGASFEFRSDEFADYHFTGGTQFGFIAQEIENVFPEVVKTETDGYKSVNYSEMIPVLVEAVKEQQKIIEDLTKRIEALERK